MDPRSWIILRMLVNRYHRKDSENFLRRIDKDHRQKIMDQSVDSGDLTPLLEEPYDEMEHIHYSWLMDPIAEYPKEIQPIILSALSKNKWESLQKALRISPFPQINLAPLVRNYLIHDLYKKIQDLERLPLRLVPNCPLSPLVEMSHNELTALIDLLGLYDLAREIRLIVDKNKLQKIYETLSPPRQKFLKACMQIPDKLAAPKIGLEKWDGKAASLTTALHNRGLLRLGKALCGQNPDLVWNIVHHLDKRRGQIAYSYFHKNEIPGVTAPLVIQVLDAIDYLKTIKT